MKWDHNNKYDVYTYKYINIHILTGKISIMHNEYYTVTD